MGNNKCLIYVTAILTVFILFTSEVYAGDIGSNDLINKAKEYDGQQITYTGEVIGDVMKRGDHAWINVYDGDNAIGIWVPYQEVSKICNTGSYNYKGDRVRVTGIFNRACAEHGGDMDVHSDTVEILDKGYKVERPVKNIKIYAAGGLSTLSIVLFVLMHKKRV